jgi:hypothetical protein
VVASYLPTRERLVKDDPAGVEIIKPYLRGQDIERWDAPWTGLWMIFTRRGIEMDLERKLSDLVNVAYGLTPEDVGLMWRTAPPRMPLDPTEELRRFGIEPGAV